MSEIPDDVMERALKACHDIGIGNDVAWPVDVARAIMAERERCANVAANMFTRETVLKTKLGGNYKSGEIAIGVGLRIATAILSGK